MSASIPGELLRAWAACSSMIKVAERSFNFRGLLLKDCAHCEVTVIQNITIFEGSNFSVNYNPAISGAAEICTCAIDREFNFLCIKKWQFLLQILFLFFPSFFFSPRFFPSLFQTSELQMPKITLIHSVLSLYENTLSKYLCQPTLIRLMFPHSSVNVFSGVKKRENLPRELLGDSFVLRKCKKISRS